MDNDNLRKRYSELSDEALLQIVKENFREYTSEAIMVAKDVLESRKISTKVVDENVAEEIQVKTVSNNTIAQIIKSIGIVGLIIGTIICLGLMIKLYFLSALLTFISVFIIGFLFIGFGEIIDLLHQINEKQNTRA